MIVAVGVGHLYFPVLVLVRRVSATFDTSLARGEYYDGRRAGGSH